MSEVKEKPSQLRSASEVLLNPNAKYYTAFLYKGKSPSELHCTHKYLGPVKPEQLREIMAIVTDYLHRRSLLKAGKPDPLQVNFSVEDFFGAKYDTRVLKPAKKDERPLLPELRKLLNKFSKDSFKSFRPHVTHAELAGIDEPFVSYALVGSGGVIIKEWKL